MRFTKMQGLGNDYLYVWGEVPDNIVDLSIKLSDRHFGAGADGMIFISPSTVADYKMRIFNADGSEAKMCGNGIRCVGKYVYDKGYTDKTYLTVETISGIKNLDLQTVAGKVKTVSVDMGYATVSDELEISVDDNVVCLTPVSVGNPHAVIFVNDINTAPLTTLGPKIEKHTAFPDGVNVEFVEIMSADNLRMRVWERGSGVTMACGTGASASVAAAVSKGFCQKNTPITVQLDGGALQITVTNDNKIIMSGPAETVYEGEVNL